MFKIMIVEDDASLKEELTIMLRANGYEPVTEMPCDLALLDVNLPGESGFSICRKIRENSNVPVIFLTARNTPEDELLAFGVGADDFVQKPYHSSVLLARIARLLKRTGEEPRDEKEVRGLTLDLAAMKASYGGAEVELTKNETRILYCLMQKEVCAKEDIIEELWGEGLYIDENTLYVNIKRLREKLARIDAKDFIRTVRGVGYRL